jgi:hypothetical protein
MPTKTVVFWVMTSVVWYIDTNVSDEHAASIFRKEKSNSRLNLSIEKGVEVNSRELIYIYYFGNNPRN